MRLRVHGFGFWVQGFGIQVEGLGFEVEGYSWESMVADESFQVMLEMV